MKVYIIIFLTGVLAGILALYFLFWPEITESQKTLTVERIEWIKKDTTIVNYRDSLITKIVDSKPSKEPDKYDSIRTYKGLENFNFGNLSWEARTLGSLDLIKFTPTFQSTIITKTTTKENTKIIKQKSLYVQSFVTNNFKFEVGVSYLNDKTILSYAYSPVHKYHKVGMGVRLIGSKSE